MAKLIKKFYPYYESPCGFTSSNEKPVSIFTLVIYNCYASKQYLNDIARLIILNFLHGTCSHIEIIKISIKSEKCKCY